MEHRIYALRRFQVRKGNSGKQKSCRVEFGWTHLSLGAITFSGMAKRLQEENGVSILVTSFGFGDGSGIKDRELVTISGNTQEVHRKVIGELIKEEQVKLKQSVDELNKKMKQSTEELQKKMKQSTDELQKKIKQSTEELQKRMKQIMGELKRSIEVETQELASKLQAQTMREAQVQQGTILILRPATWSSKVDRGASEAQLVSLSPISEEWRFCFNKFHRVRESNIFTITGIQRVENEQLWGHYSLHKKTIQNEKWLFHGTPQGTAPAISAQGYNRSYAGKKSRLYTVVHLL